MSIQFGRLMFIVLWFFISTDAFSKDITIRVYDLSAAGEAPGSPDQAPDVTRATFRRAIRVKLPDDKSDDPNLPFSRDKRNKSYEVELISSKQKPNPQRLNINEPIITKILLKQGGDLICDASINVLDWNQPFVKAIFNIQSVEASSAKKHIFGFIHKPKKKPEKKPEKNSAYMLTVNSFDDNGRESSKESTVTLGQRPDTLILIWAEMEASFGRHQEKTPTGMVGLPRSYNSTWTNKIFDFVTGITCSYTINAVLMTDKNKSSPIKGSPKSLVHSVLVGYQVTLASPYGVNLMDAFIQVEVDDEGVYDTDALTHEPISEAQPRSRFSGVNRLYPPHMNIKSDVLAICNRIALNHTGTNKDVADEDDGYDSLELCSPFKPLPSNPGFRYDDDDNSGGGGSIAY